eukprot:SAG11_NODE_3132_length_2664_cov_1.502924_1_plen_75_part_00
MARRKAAGGGCDGEGGEWAGGWGEPTSFSPRLNDALALQVGVGPACAMRAEHAEELTRRRKAEAEQQRNAWRSA